MKYNASMPAAVKRLPPWVVNGVGGLGRSEEVKARLRSAELVTVCEEARCPNIGECFSRHTATFMILGDTCTRRCGFCSVKTGRPSGVDSGEAGRVAAATADMGLAYVVITMVARDDLRDHGAQQLVSTIEALHGLDSPDGLRPGPGRTAGRSEERQVRGGGEGSRAEAIGAGGGESGESVRVVRGLRGRSAVAELPGESRVQVEVLVSDLGGRAELVAQVLEAGPEVFGHNLETVRRLTPAVRGRATYERSLSVLAAASLHARNVRQDAVKNVADNAAESAVDGAGKSPAKSAIKSGLMVGMGESRKELSEAMRDIKAAGCDLLTVGQYLRPTRNHLPVERYLEPVEFEEIAAEARELGFREIAAGPLVRSSYRADSLYRRSREQVS